MEKTKVWYSINNGGDGSAYPNWWLTREEAEWEQDNMDEGWGEPCYGSVETFAGSNIYKEAENAREKAQKLFKFKKDGLGGDDWESIVLSEEEKNRLDFLTEPPVDEWDLN